MMDSICKEAEHSIHHARIHEDIKEAVVSKGIAETVCASAVAASYEQSAKALVVLSNSGITARLCAKYRPGCPIIAVVGQSNQRTARQLVITRGCMSCVYDDSNGKKPSETRVQCGVQYAQKQLGLSPGDVIVAVHADQLGLGFANLTRILCVPETFSSDIEPLLSTTPFMDC